MDRNTGIQKDSGDLYIADNIEKDSSIDKKIEIQKGKKDCQGIGKDMNKRGIESDKETGIQKIGVIKN